MNPYHELKSRVMLRDDLTKLALAWKNQGEKIVFTNGCFDLLHQGHIDYLFQAASLGTKLIIGVNSDLSVSRLKGDHRPIQDEVSRAIILAALACTSAVSIFSEDTPIELIKNVRPDFLVKGGDYQPEQIVGYSEVLSWGGNVEIIPFLPGFSTSAIEAKIKLG